MAPVPTPSNSHRERMHRAEPLFTLGALRLLPGRLPLPKFQTLLTQRPLHKPWKIPGLPPSAQVCCNTWQLACNEPPHVGDPLQSLGASLSATQTHLLQEALSYRPPPNQALTGHFTVISSFTCAAWKVSLGHFLAGGPTHPGLPKTLPALRLKASHPQQTGKVNHPTF